MPRSHRLTSIHVTHYVPLTDMLRRVLDRVPRGGERGPFVFSRHGKTPLSGFDKLKATLPKLNSEWTLHDLRRTMVAELAIGHTKKSLTVVYDQHEFADEIVEAVTRWSKHIEKLVA